MLLFCDENSLYKRARGHKSAQLQTIVHELRRVVLSPHSRNHFSLNFCHCFGCGSDVARMWFGRGLDMVRMWFGCGSDVVRMWVGCGSDVFLDLVQTAWQKLRESGFQQRAPIWTFPTLSHFDWGPVSSPLPVVVYGNGSVTLRVSHARIAPRVKSQIKEDEIGWRTLSIFSCLKGYFYFLRSVLKVLRKYP